jgi:large subunit ribosomal protein L22
MSTKTGYQKYDLKKMVRVRGNHLPLSQKTSCEVMRYIRDRNVQKAIRLLEEVRDGTRPVPFLKFKKDVPHRKGQGLSVGRFPKKVSIHTIQLLTLLLANAKDKGLSEKALTVVYSAVNPGPNLPHSGRIRGRLRKVCHIEIVGAEKKKVAKLSKSKDLRGHAEQSSARKTETKK